MSLVPKRVSELPLVGNANGTDLIAIERSGAAKGTQLSTLETAFQKQWYGVCETITSQSAKTVALSGYSLKTGTTVAVLFKNAVNSGASLNINGTGAKTIRFHEAALASGIIEANDTVTLMYDGTYYRIVSIDKLGSGGSSSLEGLSDTDIDSPSEGQVLTFDGENWINQTPSGGGGTGTGSNTFYATCSTLASTQEKAVTISGLEQLETGMVLYVKFSENNVVSEPTLNVNSLGAKQIYQFGTTKMGNDTDTSGWRANQVVQFVYDGTAFRLVKGYNTDTIYTAGYGTNTTSGSERSVTINGYLRVEGSIIAVKFSVAVPAGGKLKVNGLSANDIYYRGLPITADVIQAGDTATMMLHESIYHVLSVDRDDTGGGSGRTYTKPWYIDSNGEVVECSGTTSKSSIQQAIDGCPVHGTVHIPWRGSTYSITAAQGTIHIAKPITIEGDYVGYDHDEYIGYNSGYSQASSYTSATNKITNAQMATPLITSAVSDASAATAGIYIHCIGVTLKNISIQCTNFTRHESAVIKAKDEFGFVDSTSRSKFNRFITIENCVAICYVPHQTDDNNDGTYCGRGIWLDSTGLTRILRTEVYGTHNAFWVSADTTVNTSIVFENCWAINFTSIGYYLYKAYYCSFISCAADSHAGNFGTDVTVGYYWDTCTGVSAVGCGCEKMTIGLYIQSCDNVSFGGVIVISKEGTSAQKTIGIQTFTDVASKVGLENLNVYVTKDAATDLPITYYKKCVKNPLSVITLINTNIESVFDGTQDVGTQNDGMMACVTG